MRSRSMRPVIGSVAADCWASLISRTASCTSFFSTTEERRILARASEILIRDSSCRGVAVMVLLPCPSFLISAWAKEVRLLSNIRSHKERGRKKDANQRSNQRAL